MLQLLQYKCLSYPHHHVQRVLYNILCCLIIIYCKMLPPKKSIRISHLGGIDVGYCLSETAPCLSKPTVVLFNPFTTTVDYYQQEFENKNLLDSLNLLAVEPLGHGQTRALKTDTFTYWDSAIMTLQLLDELGIKQAYVLGTSQGGWIAARMALVAPEKVLNPTSFSYRHSD